MSLLPVGISGEEAGYQISRSLRFNSADTAYLNRTPSSTTDRRKFTYSTWVKRGSLGTFQTFIAATDSSTQDGFLFRDNNTIQINFNNITSSQLVTTQVFRDVSAWYHLVMAIDTTQATASNRIKLYVNGIQVTAFSTANYPTQNYDTFFNTNTYLSRIGYSGLNSNPADMYMTEVHFIDGQALTPTDFGEFNSDTGVWQPIAYTGTYGTNGFYLNFSDNSGTTSTTLGADSSGNGNNWTPNNFSVTAGAGNDSMVDSPTRYGTDTGAGGEVRGNYATLNPLSVKNTPTITNGNLDFVGVNTSSYRISTATIGTSSGKWYWEATINVAPGSGENASVGITSKAFAADITNSYLGNQATEWGLLLDSGPSAYAKSHSSLSYYGVAVSNGDVIQIAYDIDDGKIWFGLNGTWFASGDPSTGANAAYTDLVAGTTYYPAANILCDTGNTLLLNFGQRPFAYTAPSGFLSLCTTNLPEPTIADGGEYFNTVLYTGNGSTQSITGVGFQPDWVWIKERSGTSFNTVFDVLRGTNKNLYTNTTDDEETYANTLTAFGSDGFSLGSAGWVNTNTSTYVAWNWKANGAGVSNTAGTITSTVSVNTTSGFSIVTYTGNGGNNATVGHGLGVAPRMIIVKNRTDTIDWAVWHGSEPTKAAYLNQTGDFQTGSFAALGFNEPNASSTFPTSSVFYVSASGRAYNSDITNGNGDSIVAYCFAAVPGFSAFGSYTGNGSTDGPFVYLGFRPAFVLVKSATSIRSWLIADSVRNTYNIVNLYLLPSSSGAEGTNNLFDFTSNGFKVRDSLAGINESGQTLIYMAFAENPFAYSLAR